MSNDLKLSNDTAGLHHLEHKVLIGLCNNQTLGQIGEDIGVSPNTLIGYRNRLYRALGVHSAREAIEVAWRRGIFRTCPTCRRPR